MRLRTFRVAPRLALLLFAAASARLDAAESPGPLARALDPILDRPALAAAFWGAEVKSLRTGRLLYSRNPRKNLKPASTLKLVTTAAALDVFGAGERLRTTVETAGRLDASGRILGDVYLVGGGDPNLSGRFHAGRITAVFEEMADALSKSGVKRIEGRLVGHDGLFTGDRRGEDWAWGDLTWWYGAEISALTFNDNCADLKVTAGERAGDPVVVDRDPVSSHYRVLSTATTSPAGTPSGLVFRREAGSNVLQISGTYPIGQAPWTASVALEDPARYAATVFAEVLGRKGIAVTGEISTSSTPLPAGRRTLAVHESEPMAEIVKVVNKVSHNLHAEMLLRLVGTRRRGAGTVEAAREAVDDFLQRVGVEKETWGVQDGSGLSRSDLLTARGMVQLLTAMAKHPAASAFVESLPVAGVDGTLKNRMKDGLAHGKAQAKTGSIRNVNALGGYVTTRSGERLVFYVASNHHESSSDAVGAIDALVSALAAQK
jgi:serine-type D-Ala-D-Ala carboxypeptidase/endopeptidase (penicillin-binding protein 4)